MQSLPRTPGFPLALLVILSTLSGAASAQNMSQTLPAGYMNVDGDSATSHTVNTLTDSTWHWHYDSGQFAATQEILITEVYVRASDALASVQGFSFPSFEVSLIEASTDYVVGSHNTVFAANVIREEIVRAGSWTGSAPASGGLTADWIPLRLQHGFVYDPSTGNDFIVQIRNCSAFSLWGVSMDGVSGTAGTVGGNRYGHSASCTATSQNTFNNEFVPIVRLDYREVQSQTLPAGFDSVNGSSGTGFPQNSTSDQVWQWHYDASEFTSSGPISISEISVRAVSPTMSVSAFDFAFFEVTLIEAATNYTASSHSTTFASNVFRSEVCKSTRWKQAATPASGGVAATWIPFQLDRSFTFDPTNGRDLIIQIRKCGTLATWGVSLDGIGGAPGAAGGNRYGHTSDCFATAENFRNNEYAPIVRLTYTDAVVSQFPFEEDFDSFVGVSGTTEMPPGWSQPFFDQGDWFTRNLPTPSTGTGPTADHSTGLPGVGFYAHTEDSNGEQNPVNLETPVLDLGVVSNPRLSFWVHSNDNNFGANENFLHVDLVLYPSNFVIPDVIPPIGHLGSNEWEPRLANLSGFSQPLKIRFRGTTDGGSFSHDIAIDDVCVFDFSPGNGQAPQPFASLDINACVEGNGLGVALMQAGPYDAAAPLGGSIDFTFEGDPNRPVALFLGALNPGLSVFPFGQFDIGDGVGPGGVPTGLVVLADGNGLLPLDSLFRTDLFGEMRLSFSTPFFPPGTNFTVQGAVFGGPLGAGLTNAVTTTIVP